jgi:glycogen phosphorylase
MTPNLSHQRVAYFSMEVGLDFDVPTYSGGLGVLAGDTLKSAADLGLPVVAVSLLYHQGYFKQLLDESGAQQEELVEWKPADFMTKLDGEVSVKICGENVQIGCWRYDIIGVTGESVPVYFLDVNLSANTELMRRLSNQLYGGDQSYRLMQEAVLGLGGVLWLKKLQLLMPADRSILCHMNEGHAALLTLGLLEHFSASSDERNWGQYLETVKENCIFTTHTPVQAGHDRFEYELVQKVLGDSKTSFLQNIPMDSDGCLNMSKLAIFFARFINGVAKRHGEVSNSMFPGAGVQAITNGVHAKTWLTKPMQALLNEYIPNWQIDNDYLRYAIEIPKDRLWSSHLQAKEDLFKEIKHLTGQEFKVDDFTIGFARRAAEYKRGDMLFDNLPKLKDIAQQVGKLQIVFAGKAHPKDCGGKEIIKRINELGRQLRGYEVEFVYLPNYDMRLGQLITGGVDLWLNNPIKPLEASGTSGMKAALNGVPSLSTLDGWWVEGCIEGITGWEIDDEQDGMKSNANQSPNRPKAASSLYEKLRMAAGYFYENKKEYQGIMRNCIALNGSYFNTQRMVSQYLRLGYQKHEIKS